MRLFVLATLFGTVLALPAAAARISSAYTDLDVGKVCTKYAAPKPGEEGDWANFVCAGYKGYPVFLFYGDLRESLFYGFPPTVDPAPRWESFSGFNRSGPRIEWRLETNGDTTIPFATIHRWFVSDSEDATRETEVLVVEKVGQPDKREGCAVGYVVATGNPRANEQARKIADQNARTFRCGTSQPAEISGGVPMPAHTRFSN